MTTEDGICEMTMKDYRAVAALWREAKMWPHPGEGRAWVERALARNPRLFLVYKENGRVIGTALGAWDGLRGCVYHLAVKEERRGAGIGSLLLVAAEERLRAAGARQVNIMVYEENRRGMRFYTDRGYEGSPVAVFRKRFGGRKGRGGC